MGSSDMHISHVRVAVCFAGAFRHWPSAYTGHIRPNIVEALGPSVDIFAVCDVSSKKNDGSKENNDVTYDVAKMRSVFGARFRAGEQVDAAHMANVSGHAFAEIALTQEAKQKNGRNMMPFPYVYKIWRCGQLIHRSGVQYDVVIRMRPDLIPLQPFRLARANSSGSFELQVGGRCVRFGRRDVIIHAYTNRCGNDWFQMGTLKSMTVTMDMARFWTPASSFLSPNRAWDTLFSSGLELAYSYLWWRTGTTVHRTPLFFELARQKCRHASCLRMPAWSILPRLRPSETACALHPAAARPHVGALQWSKTGIFNDCGAPSGRGDLEHFSGPIPGQPLVDSVHPRPFNKSDPVVISILANRTANWKLDGTPERLAELVDPPPPWNGMVSAPDAWIRPVCSDVPDLGVHNPLTPCRKSTGDEASYQPSAHRPKVLRGYGQPMIFDPGSRRPDER